MSYLNVGNGTGWMIDDNTDQDPQQEKIDRVLYITERVLETLKEVVSIYAKFGDAEAFSTFQSRVDEVMKKANYESYFNDDNYTETGQ